MTRYTRPSGRAISSAVGAIFGLVFVLANAGAVGQPWAVLVSGLAGAEFATFLVALAASMRRADVAPATNRSRFGRTYWAVVAGEAVLLFVGRALLRGPLDLPAAVLPWVTLVVGVHFFALAYVFQARIHHLVGAVLTACGAAGLALAAADPTAPVVALVAGAIPGFALLGFSVWGVLPTSAAQSFAERGAAPAAGANRPAQQPAADGPAESGVDRVS